MEGMMTGAPDVNDNAPDFTLDTTHRDGFNLHTEAAKQPILLYFHVATFGINCTNYMMKLIERADDFERMGVRFMPINPDSKEVHIKWMERMQSPYEHIIDTGQEDGRMTVDLAKLEASLLNAEAVPLAVETLKDIPVTVIDDFDPAADTSGGE